jgi:hypothetical protein
VIRRLALRLAVLLPALIMASGAAAVRAQAQASTEWKSNVVASVSVAPPPILLETTRNLYFGNVGPGSDVIVPAQPPYIAGTWSAGARFSNLRKTVNYGVTLQLPAVLSKGSGPTLPVSWNGTQYGWMCVWNTTTGTPSVCGVQQVSFNPSSHTATPLVINLPNNTPQNNVFAADIYVGGRLTIPVAPLAPGVYSAPIKITVAAIN